MKFSAQEEYGLRCLMAIAKAPGGTATIPEIGRAEQLSESHVAKLTMVLRKAGFLESTRGHTGGYTLSRCPSKIMIGDVLEALGGRLYDHGFCTRHSGLVEKCVHGSDCAVWSLWSDIQAAVDDVTFRLSLQDVLESESNKPTVRLRPAPPKDYRPKAGLSS